MKHPKKKYLSLDNMTVEGQNISYSTFGEGDIDLVIEMGLGAVAGEWWHIAEHLSKQFSVLLYERGRDISKVRSPKNIAEELHALLMRLPCKDKILILAHSQGGLYAQQFARMYPDMVRGIVFEDPLSANDNTYKSVFLTAAEQKKSGFNKAENLVIMRKMALCHLGFLIKLIMRKAPPFYYYDKFSPEAEKYILDELTNIALYDAAIEEYRLAHEENEICRLKEKGDFPQIPIVLITHGSEFEIKEIMEFGQTTREFAVKVEELWQSLITSGRRGNINQVSSSSRALPEPALRQGGRGAALAAPARQGNPCRSVNGCPGAPRPAYCPLTPLPLP